MENLLKDKHTKTKSGAQGAEKNNDETFLKELADQLDDCESRGPDVNAQLAAIVNKRWSRKLAQEKLKPILDKYKEKEQKTAQHLSRPGSTLKSGVSCSWGKREQILRKPTCSNVNTRSLLQPLKLLTAFSKQKRAMLNQTLTL